MSNQKPTDYEMIIEINSYCNITPLKVLTDKKKYERSYNIHPDQDSLLTLTDDVLMFSKHVDLL